MFLLKKSHFDNFNILNEIILENFLVKKDMGLFILTILNFKTFVKVASK